jgi:hypothetical protein
MSEQQQTELWKESSGYFSTMKMEAAGYYGTLVTIYQTTRRHSRRSLVSNEMSRLAPVEHHSIVLVEYLVATVHGKLRSGRAGPFVKVEGCCD